MSGYQQILIMGHLGGDPVLRYTPTGTAVCNFSVAVNQRWNGQGGEPKENVTWFRVAAWRALAESCATYLAKGRQVMVIGRIEASAWVGDDGQPRAALELTARDVRFLSGARNLDIPPERDYDEEEEIPF